MHRHHVEPIIGSWYEARNLPASFSVVDCDRDGNVEIQYIDGEIDQIDRESWDSIAIEEIAEPEDAAAPYGLDHDENVSNLLNEMEEQSDLDEKLHNVNHDEDTWM